jgi:hypothetical protein
MRLHPLALSPALTWSIAAANPLQAIALLANWTEPGKARAPLECRVPLKPQSWRYRHHPAFSEITAPKGAVIFVCQAWR